MCHQTKKSGDSRIARHIRGYQRRIRFMKFVMVILMLCILVALPFGLMVLVEGFGSRYGVLFGVLFAAGIVAIPAMLVVARLTEKQEKKLKVYIGEHVIKDVVAEKIDIIEYEPDKWINTDFIKKCMILPNYDRTSGSDYIKGTYKGVPIVYCDLKLEMEYQETDDDGHSTTRYRTVFHGHLINLELGQEINGYLRIKERKNPRKGKGFFSDVLKGIADVMQIKTADNIIEVENVAFNNQFEIKTNNDEMAFYILTPQFMENIIKADQYAQGYTNIEFAGKYVNIVMNNGRDSFEVTKTMRSAKALEKSRQQMRDDLNRIISIVDEILEKDKLF